MTNEERYNRINNAWHSFGKHMQHDIDFVLKVPYRDTSDVCPTYHIHDDPVPITYFEFKWCIEETQSGCFAHVICDGVVVHTESYPVNQRTRRQSL